DRMMTLRKGLLFALVCLLAPLVAAGAALAETPSRVLIVVMDQMQPGYAEQFDMTNVLWLQEEGVDFANAYVGDMASETVVSHNVMMSGLFPKHMGWSDEVLRDTDNVLGYGAGAIVTVGDLSYNQYVALIENEGYPKLGDYMHEAYPDSIVANFGQKKYQVNSTAASSSDYWAFMGSTKNTPPPYLPWTGKYRGPDGNVPWYIADDNRFKISSGNAGDTYGTKVDEPAWLYPEDGRYAPGPYEDHLSGDAWVADAAIKVMENERNWSAIHLNFSGIDKIGHMWGGGAVDTFWDPSSPNNQVHMTFIAKNADDQLGRVIQALRDLGQLDETLIVVLGDHGSTYAETAPYVDAAGGGNLSWYYDPNSMAANTTYGRPGANNEAVLGPLNATDNVAYSYQSTAIETWLIDQSWAMKVEAAGAMATLPGVIATYVKSEDGNRYVLNRGVTSTRMNASELMWWLLHGQELVNTMAFDGSADVVGLLADKTSYGVYGDHGGAQKDVQRIPMIMYSPSMLSTVDNSRMRLVDVMPTVLRTMGIPLAAPVDGRAYRLPVMQ
ncbi:MAG: sulfatase-like hydrolase/transferase, partial [Actinomycetes bacterium]